MNRYMIVKDNKILRIYHTKDNMNSIHKIMAKYEIENYEVQEVPKDNEYAPNKDIREYENHKLKSEEQRIIEGFLEIPKGKKIDKGKVIDKTILEQITDKDIVLNDNEYYDKESKSIKIKKPEISEEDKREQVIQDELRLMAIERLERKEALSREIDNGNYRDTSI